MNHKNFLFFALTVLINSTGHNALDGESIMGGEDAQYGEYPYTVSIQRNNKNICAGAIIDKYHVVTAAHCVVSNGLEFIYTPLMVVAGTQDLNAFTPMRREVYVKKVSIPARYYAVSHNLRTGDIAVLRLSEPVDLGPDSRLKIPGFYENHNNLTAVVTGFGWNKISGVHTEAGKFVDIGTSSQKMRFVNALILNRTQCATVTKLSLPWAFLCAKSVQRNLNKVEGVCGGDSGGPLVVKGKLVGVVNDSPVGCNEKFLPTIYTRVSSYSSFIKNAVKDKPDPFRHSTMLPVPGK